MREKLIVALDTDAHAALRVAESLRGHVNWLKAGMTLYYSEGPEIVRRLAGLGFQVFVDLKLHDIPHQAEGAAREIARTGASMLTVHASGGRAMMEAALRGAAEGSQERGLATPHVLAVTVLTSMDEAGLQHIGVARSTAEQVELLGKLARDSGLQGVVCSAHEAAAMRSLLGGEALVVTPGVRVAGADVGDQARVATPGEAVAAGASHVVVGRPITQAADPVSAVETILAEE